MSWDDIPPGGGGPEAWLGGRLLGRRVVMLSGPLTAISAGNAVVQLMTLDAEGDGSVDLYIDAEGDDLGAALSLMDVIDLLGVEVNATGIGRVYGTAAGVLAVCSVRRVSRSTRLRLSEPHFDVTGNASEVGSWRRHAESQVASYVRRLAEACGQTPERIEADLSRGLFLDAAGAVDYGLADAVTGQLRMVAGNSDT